MWFMVLFRWLYNQCDLWSYFAANKVKPHKHRLLIWINKIACSKEQATYEYWHGTSSLYMYRMKTISPAFVVTNTNNIICINVISILSKIVYFLLNSMSKRILYFIQPTFYLNQSRRSSQDASMATFLSPMYVHKYIQIKLYSLALPL